MPDIHEFIICYLDGSIEEKDRVFLLNWLKQSEANRSFFYEIRDLWLSCHVHYANEIKAGIAFDQFRKRVMAMPKPGNNILKRKIPAYHTVWIAASILLLFSIGYVFTQKARRLSGGEAMNCLLTAEGSKGRFILPDSSIVWLNGNSTLKYPNSFDGKNREVFLDGEAYFEVKKHHGAGFIVHAKDIRVKVLGTQFLVQSYPGKDEIETVLVEGKVEVTDVETQKDYTLQPGQLYKYSRQDKRADIVAVNSLSYVGWIHNKLVFDNSRLEDIVVGLEKWYGVKFICSDLSILEQKASFKVQGEPLEEILNALIMIVPINYRLEGNTIYLDL